MNHDQIMGRLKDISPEYLRPNDLTAAVIFSQVFRDQHRFCQTARQWFCYEGGIWKMDRDGLRASKSIKQLARVLMEYATKAELPEELQKNFLKFCGQWFRASYRDSVLKDARDQFCFNREDLDANPYLLCVQNGVLDLTPGKMRFLPHAPELLMSRKANVTYDKDAGCPRYLQFLNEIMEGNHEKARFLETYHALGLIGKSLEDKLLIEWGKTTRNGKSTYEGIIEHVLGDYCLTIAPESLAIRQPDSRRASGDIARLSGARFVTCSELPRKLNLDAALVKSLTGGDLITARHLNESEFSFRPCFNIAIHTNHLPQVSDNTVFTSGRMMVLTFDRHFSEAEQDSRLDEKLQAESSGILNRLIAALQRYYRDGLCIPGEVKSATKEFAEDSDRIQAFLDEVLTKDDKSCAAVSAIYPLYSKWCLESGYNALSKSSFIDGLREKLIYRKSGTVDGKTCRNVIFGYNNFAKMDDAENPF